MDLRLYSGVLRGEPVSVQFDGDSFRAYAGEPLAVALHAAGIKVLSRSLKYHRARGAFCHAGHCAGCLVRADGLPSEKSCQLACREGLVASGQNVMGSSEHDALAAVDWLFPGGMDHHTLMTGSNLVERVGNAVMQKMVRQLSGLGQLPSYDDGREPRPLPDVEERRCDVVVVGGGPAGLAAATACGEAGLDTLLVDEQPELGGSWLADPHGRGVALAAQAEARARAARVDLRRRAVSLCWFPEDDGGLLAVATPERLVRVKARAYVYATGGYEVNAAFADNDRPGVMAARAVGRLLGRWRVRPGDKVCVLGAGREADALLAALAQARVETVHADGSRLVPLRARGATGVEALEVQEGRSTRKLPCDLVAVVALPAPASEAPRQHGARVELDPLRGGFAVLTTDEGATSVPGVWACGDVTGAMGPEAAAQHGARVGAAAARSLHAGR